MAQSEHAISKKRRFGGSWFLVIAPFFACVFRIWYDFGKQGLFDQAENIQKVIQVLIDNWPMTLDIAGWYYIKIEAKTASGEGYYRIFVHQWT